MNTTDQTINLDISLFFRSTETECPITKYSLVTNRTAQQTVISGLTLANFAQDDTSLKIVPKTVGNFSIEIKAMTASGVEAY